MQAGAGLAAQCLAQRLLPPARLPPASRQAVILLHPPLPLAGVSTWIKRGRQQSGQARGADPAAAAAAADDVEGGRLCVVMELVKQKQHPLHPPSSEAGRQAGRQGERQVGVQVALFSRKIPLCVPALSIRAASSETQTIPPFACPRWSTGRQNRRRPGTQRPWCGGAWTR